MWDLTVQDVHDFFVIPVLPASDAHQAEDGTAILVHNCSRNQGVYIFDDMTKPGSVYVGKTKNFAVRLAAHVRAGRIADPMYAICVHICGDDIDLRISGRHMFESGLAGYGIDLSSGIEPYGQNLYNARQARWGSVGAPIRKMKGNAIGTWDYGPFDNDTAADFAADLDVISESARIDKLYDALAAAQGCVGRIDGARVRSRR